MVDKIEHIQATDVLNAGRDKINKFAIDPAMRAETNSIQAKDIADQASQISDEAKGIAKNTDGRLDNIIAEEMQDAEVIDARKPFGEDAFPNLAKRLDEQIGKNMEFRDFESANSFMKRVNNEFSERALNSKWFDTSTNAAMQSLIDFAISEKRNITFETGDYLLPLTIDGAVDMTIDFASSNLSALVDNQTNSPLLEIKNCQKLTLKNFTIDGLGKNPRAIQITNSKVLAIHNFTVKNLNLAQDGSVNTFGIEIDTTQCRDIQINDFKIDNLSSINNDIIGDAQGMTRGIHLKSSEKKSLKNAKILFSNFTITNLESEDADAIHL
ncbi:hypothetical protein ACQUFD_05995, partial [Enterococcus gallinarum]|uniref:hypothetical protein n=1 Tax=Enterococcus gallinarum TaxID=1353 RepID=UPI003D0E5BC4